MQLVATLPPPHHSRSHLWWPQNSAPDQNPMRDFFQVQPQAITKALLGRSNEGTLPFPYQTVYNRCIKVSEGNFHQGLKPV